MRILFFTHYFPPEGNAPASRIYELGKRWVKEGHEVQVITCVPNVPNGIVYEGYKNHLVQTEIIDGIRTTRVWTYIASNKGTVKRILNYLSYMFSATLAGLFAKRPDVVIATSPQFFCGWAGIILSMLRHLPFILEIRDIWPESIITVGALKNKPLLCLLEWLETKMYQWAKHIVTLGQGYRQKLLKKGVSDDKISIVMNGIDQELFAATRGPDTELKNRLGLTGKFVCSYIGTIGMACGLDIVIRAAQILKNKNRNDIAFMIVGDGAIHQELESKAKQLNIENVVFTGRQDKSLMPAFLSITDVCLVHLKKADLFTTVMPSKLFEAAGMAKPIIIGVAGFAMKFVEDANAGINIEPENEKQLVEAVEKLANNPVLCKQYGESGYEYVTRHFNRDDLAKDYLDVITKLYCSAAEPAPANN